MRRQHDCIANQRRFGRTRRRQDEPAPITACLQRHRQRAADGAQLAGQPKLAGELVLALSMTGDLLRCNENADRDRQVEVTRFLR